MSKSENLKLMQLRAEERSALVLVGDRFARIEAIFDEVEVILNTHLDRYVGLQECFKEVLWKSKTFGKRLLSNWRECGRLVCKILKRKYAMTKNNEKDRIQKTIETLERRRRQVEKLTKRLEREEMKTFGKALIGLIDKYLANEREMFDELNDPEEGRKEES